jgi:hypothetical protein
MASHLLYGCASDRWPQYQKASNCRRTLAGRAGEPYGRRTILYQRLGSWPQKPNADHAMACRRFLEGSPGDTIGSWRPTAGVSQKEEIENEAPPKVERTPSETARRVAGSCNKPDGAVGGARSSVLALYEMMVGSDCPGNSNAWARLEVPRRGVWRPRPNPAARNLRNRGGWLRNGK